MTRPGYSPGLAARLVQAMGNRISVQRKNRVCVINYHRILEAPDPLLPSEPDVAAFRGQMQLLADYFNVLSLPDALAAQAAGCLPPRAVCITFDDGYRSVHDLALPILREFALPATVFVTTGYVGAGNMWNEKIIDAVRKLPEAQVDLGGAGLGVRTIGSLHDRQRLLDEVTERAKYLPPPQRLALTQQLEALAGPAHGDGLMLTPAMIRTLAASQVEIGAHTVSHPILCSLDDDTARYEIEQSRRDLEAITGTPVRYFAYPNGKPGRDYAPRHAQMAREAGFEAAFSTVVGAATEQHDRYQLPRSRPWDDNRMLYALRLLRWLAD